MTAMTDPIPSAGETTIIGLPAITVPVTSTGDRPLTKEDLNTIMRLADGTALLISTRGAVSGSRYLLDEDEITVGRDPVIDAGSLNGTYVNRQRVDSQELKNGDEIILGKFRLVYFTNKAVIA